MLDVVGGDADAATVDALSADVDADVSDAARGADIDLTLCNTNTAAELGVKQTHFSMKISKNRQHTKQQNS